jgi:hypothetical protein
MRLHAILARARHDILVALAIPAAKNQLRVLTPGQRQTQAANQLVWLTLLMRFQFKLAAVGRRPIV